MAVAKNKATRQARHTLGKQQKKAVKGAPPAATSGTAMATAAPPKPTA